jgi:Integrase core domain
MAGDFLRALIRAVPYRVHTVRTDNGTPFTTPGNTASAATLIREAIARGEVFRAHAFEVACAQNGVDHRLTKPRHPWTNGQVGRMNRTIKEAIVRRYHYESHDQLRRHLGDFVAAYNFARRLKTLKGLTPYEHICAAWAKEPARFTADPTHQMPGPKHPVTRCHLNRDQQRQLVAEAELLPRASTQAGSKTGSLALSSSTSTRLFSE